MASKNHYISQFLISGNDIVNASVTFADLGTVYTDNVTEGTSLYFSNARVANAFVGTGTANALLYLNASKVATSASALTFDGTTLTSSVGSSAANYIFNSSANTPYIRFDQSNSAKFFIGESSIVGGGGSGNYDFYATAGLGIRFFANATEGMRLTSTGLTTQKDATIYGLTVGRGAGAVATNTALGVSALAANTTGSSNTAVGNTALYSNITGATNTAFGSRAGYFATSSDNTLVGNDAGRMITTGANNTALGSYVMNNSAGVTGSENVGIGRAVLTALTSGSYNIAVGSQSLYNNTTASNNTAVGYQAGYSNTTGSITVFGYRSLYNNSTGVNNVAVGNSVLQGITTANGNTAVGDSTLAVSTAGFNSAFGYRALTSNTTGTDNNAFGYLALLVNTTGSQNTAFGQSALANNTTGNSNTAVGSLALGYSGTNIGDGNTAVGSSALRVNTSGSYNTAIGGGVPGVYAAAMQSNTTGISNTAIGNGSLGSNTTGNYNTALGLRSLYSNTTADNNTAVGFQSGYSTTTGAQNTYIGRVSGFYNLTSNYNTFIGDTAGYSTTGGFNTFVGGTAGYVVTGAKNTILGMYTGNQGGLDIRTASNYIVLSDGDGNPRQYFDNNGISNIPSGSEYFGSIARKSSSAVSDIGSTTYLFFKLGSSFAASRGTWNIQITAWADNDGASATPQGAIYILGGGITAVGDSRFGVLKNEPYYANGVRIVRDGSNNVYIALNKGNPNAACQWTVTVTRQGASIGTDVLSVTTASSLTGYTTMQTI